MKILGYVVSKSRIKNKVDYISYVSDFESVEKDKPCLIVGLSDARKIASDKFSILRKRIDDNLFWTFGRTEKRDEFEVDLNRFYEFVLNNNINNIKYIYLNLLNITYSVLKRLYVFCNSSERKYIYIWNDMVYILCRDNSVIGFSLRMLKYIGYDTDKIISKLKSNKYNVINFNDSFMNQKTKKITEKRKYIIPYIMSIMEEN